MGLWNGVAAWSKGLVKKTLNSVTSEAKLEFEELLDDAKDDLAYTIRGYKFDCSLERSKLPKDTFTSRVLEFIKEDPIATFKRAHEDDAAYDMVSTRDIYIHPDEAVLVPTGIRVAIPQGYQGILTHRSSLASKNKCSVILGIIDSGYRGEVFANVHNFSLSDRFLIERGFRFCQMAIVPVYIGTPNEVTKFTSGEETPRARGGFGSTGTVGVTGLNSKI
jgi:dUTP pyrophosphatase